MIECIVQFWMPWLNRGLKYKCHKGYENYVYKRNPRIYLHICYSVISRRNSKKNATECVKYQYLFSSEKCSQSTTSMVRKTLTETLHPAHIQTNTITHLNNANNGKEDKRWDKRKFARENNRKAKYFQQHHRYNKFQAHKNRDHVRYVDLFVLYCFA